MRTPRARVGLLTAVLLLAACGSDDAASNTTTGTTTSTSADPAPASSLTPVSSRPPAAPISDPEETAPESAPETNPASSAPIVAPGTSDTPARPPDPLSVDELLALGRPIVLAHAGGEDQHPHSTPFAFSESAAARVDMLDLDVQLSADGVLVVHHDETVDRTTNASGDVAAMTYAELRDLDNAHWFTARCVCRDQPDEAYIYRGIRTGEREAPEGYSPEDFIIPRFVDIAARFPHLPLNIEVKGTGAPAIEAARVLAEELTELDRLESAVVSSFDDAVVSAFASFAPEVEVSPGLGLSSAWILDGTPLPEGMRILQLPPEFQGIEVLSDENVARSHAQGYVIWVWPNDRDLEDHESYVELLERGMDGLNINFPAEGVRALDDVLGGAG